MIIGLVSGAAAFGTAPAAAADECGAPVNGQVTCTAAGNPYAAGITYGTTGDIAVITTSDARVGNTIAVTSGAGTATVASGGTVATTAAGSRGINVSANGDVTVSANGVTTSAANSPGIVASSTAGAVTVTSTSVAVGAAGGPGILAVGQGAVSVTSGAASAIDNSAIYATSRAGPLTLAVSGATTAGSASDAAIVGNSGSTVVVTVASGATVSGTNGITLSSATGATVTNAGTLTGTNGYAVMVNRGAATVTNSGTLTGRVNFLGNNTAATNSSFVNTGTFNVTGFSLFGLGAPTFTNSGTVQVLASAPIANLSFIGLASTANSGTISLANARVGDVLTLPGTFAGSGASRVLLDAHLGANPSVDQLVIGGAATGTTTIAITNLDSSAGLGLGTVVVQAGAGTSATAFQLASGSTTSGFTSYNLVFNAANDSFTLFGTPSAAAYAPLRFIEGARNVSNQTADFWSAHMRSERDAPGATGRLWGGIFGARDTRHDYEGATVFGQAAVNDLSYHQDYVGAQIGLDLLHIPGPAAVTLGITGGYTHSRQTFAADATRARFNTADAGAYLSFKAGPLFVNLLGKYDFDAIRYSDRTLGFAHGFHGHGYGAKAEVGYRGDMGGFYLEPLVSASYEHTKLNDITALASQFDFDGADGLLGKAGLRIGKDLAGPGGSLAIYVGGNAVKDLGSRDALFYTSNGTTLEFRGSRMPLYGEGYAGLTLRGPVGVSGFVEAVGTFGKSSALRGGGGRAGVRIGF